MKIVILRENTPADNKREFPAFYTKPDSTLQKSGKPFFLPDDVHAWQATLHVVALADRLGKAFAPRFAHRYYDQMALGFVLSPLGADGGQEWTDALDGTAMVGPWGDKQALAHAEVCWLLDGKPQWGRQLTEEILQEMDDALSALSRVMTWRHGDLLYGRPLATMGRLAEGGRLQVMADGVTRLEMHIR